MKQKEHLPVYGVGPLCVFLMVGILIVAIVIEYLGFMESGEVQFFKIPMEIVGFLLIVLGIFIWIKAVLVSQVGDAILENRLVTTGIYRWVRNPIYSAIAIVLTGISLFFSNLWLLILPILFWLDITLLMKFTEEKWLFKLYGEEYQAYCQSVNRCIPWFPRR